MACRIRIKAESSRGGCRTSDRGQGWFSWRWAAVSVSRVTTVRFMCIGSSLRSPAFTRGGDTEGKGRCKQPAASRKRRAWLWWVVTAEAEARKVAIGDLNLPRKAQLSQRLPLSACDSRRKHHGARSAEYPERRSGDSCLWQPSPAARAGPLDQHCLSLGGACHLQKCKCNCDSSLRIVELPHRCVKRLQPQVDNSIAVCERSGLVHCRYDVIYT